MSGKPTNPKLYARAKAIVKARVKKWPSAYASGQLVQQYKKMGGTWRKGTTAKKKTTKKK